MIEGTILMSRPKFMGMHKKCPKCKEIKTLVSFRIRASGSPTSYCLPCQKAYDSKRHRPDARWRHLKRKYGITIEEFDKMLSSQGSRCAICDTSNPWDGVRPNRGWNIDHCHKTNKIRGILCCSCNMALGNAKDSIDILHKMISYLNNNIGVA
jgi:hypothetical protein